MENKKNGFSEKLRTIRKLRGFTQQELSDVIGIKRSAYAYYELGKSEPNLEALKRIADALGVSSDYLLNPDDAVGESMDSYRTMLDNRKEKDELAGKINLLDEKQLKEVSNYIDFVISKNN